MAAKFIPLGQPAHDAERQAVRFLVEQLPGTFTVYGNPWLVERTGVVYETDAIVVAPHAIFVIEIKAYRGTIEGTDYDWYAPDPMKSPIGLNRKTAQVLNTLMKRESHEAGQIWVQGLVFLSAATACNVRGPASRDRIHTRSSILEALQNPELITRIASRVTAHSTPSTQAALHRILTSEDTAPRRARPARRIREYEVERNLETHDNCKELLARNTLSGDRRVLRLYGIPPLANDEERELIRKRARWEAQVLGRLGKLDGILRADPPFEDEVGIVLPLEYFESITLATWSSATRCPRRRSSRRGSACGWTSPRRSRMPTTRASCTACSGPRSSSSRTRPGPPRSASPASTSPSSSRRTRPSRSRRWPTSAFGSPPPRSSTRSLRPSPRRTSSAWGPCWPSSSPAVRCSRAHATC
jgi:hypothetical protein